MEGLFEGPRFNAALGLFGFFIGSDEFGRQALVIDRFAVALPEARSAMPTCIVIIPDSAVCEFEGDSPDAFDGHVASS